MSVCVRGGGEGGKQRISSPQCHAFYVHLVFFHCPFSIFGEVLPKEGEGVKDFFLGKSPGNSFFSLIDIMVIYYGGSITILDT